MVHNQKEKTETEIIESLLLWIRSFSWEENDCQTDAEMDFVISGIAGCHLEERVDIAAIDARIIKKLVLAKAAQFADIHVIEELSWSIEDAQDECGVPMKTICVNAGIHLGEPGFPFDGDDDEEEGEGKVVATKAG
ncbi:MAG: hypothetical protein IJJ33_10060 [Victivallales bacterium]|nr:hypothetical protein [Victivallales bacterium]